MAEDTAIPPKPTAAQGSQTAELPVAELSPAAKKLLDELLVKESSIATAQWQQYSNAFIGKGEVHSKDIIASETQAQNALLDAGPSLFVLALGGQDQQLAIKNYANAHHVKVPDNFFSTAAFTKEYIHTPAHRKSLDSAPTQTEAAFLSDQLDKNGGAALLDNHLKAAMWRGLRRMAPLLKPGETVYLETPYTKTWKDLSVQELRDLAANGHVDHTDVKTGKLEKIDLPTRAQLAKAYNVDISLIDPDAMTEQALAFSDLKEKRVRLVHIDERPELFGKGEARGIYHSDTRISHDMAAATRVSRSNYLWTDAILADRKMLAGQHQENGRYIVAGGLAHFTTFRQTVPGYIESGLVAQALGIPTIGFEKGNVSEPFIDEKNKTSLPYRKGDNPNGPDFYIRAGGDYPDFSKVFMDKSVNVIGAYEHLNPAESARLLLAPVTPVTKSSDSKGK